MIKILVSTVIFINQDKEILMEKRLTTTGNISYWQFPGGKVESNETLEAAIVREVNEELNINIKETNLEPFLFKDYIKDNKLFLVFYFLCKKWEGIIKPCEQQQLCWFKIDNIDVREILPYNTFIFNKLIKLI